MKLRILETYNAKDSFTSINNPDRIAANWIGNEMVGNVTLNDYMRYEKGQDAKIEYMSPTEYLDRCVKDIFHGSWNKDIAPIQKYNAETITKYAEAMMNGDKFPIPYLNYVTENQEGRHRALAVIEAFGEDSIIPVLVIKPTDPTEEEIRKYAEKRWPNDPEWGTEYVKSKYDKFSKETESNEIEDLEYEEDEMDNEEIDDTDFDLDSELDSLYDDIDNENFLKFVNNRYHTNYNSVEDIDAITFTQALDKYFELN